MRLPAGLDRDIVRTLAATGDALRDARDRWWIITGAAAALHGADTGVSDIDVLLSVDDALRLLPPIGVTPAAGRTDGRFRSRLFSVWDANPIRVEFMAGFRFNGPKGWEDVWPATRQYVAVADTGVFVPDLNELIAMFNRFDRPRDRERIAILRALR